MNFLVVYSCLYKNLNHYISYLFYNMRVQIYSMTQEGIRGDSEFSFPTARDIINSQGLVDDYLLSVGFTQGIGSLIIKPQGWGHAFPYCHSRFFSTRILADTCVYFNPANNSGMLEVDFAIEPANLELIIEGVTKASNLPEQRWQFTNFGEIDVTHGFSIGSNNPVCVRDIIERIKRISGNGAYSSTE
jgi:hypothetical protein